MEALGWKHPAFWSIFQHKDGDYGLHLDFKAKEGQVIPWETTQLNVSKDGWMFDYTYLGPEDPPSFVPYDFEIFDWRWWGVWGPRNWHWPFVAGAIYLVGIFSLQRWMRDRPAYDLKYPLFFWNAALGIFSIIGFARVTPEFLYFLWDRGIYKTICYREGGNYPLAFWSLLWGLSKYVELGDTVFIVLRKRPLQFIQWFHHVMTMIASWLTAMFLEPIARSYVWMNYGVHSMMYPYFAAHALGIKIPRKVAVFITTCQLAQMLAGFLINFASALLMRLHIPCYRHPFSILLCATIYGTFIVLFSKLFYDVVFKNTKKEKKIKPE